MSDKDNLRLKSHITEQDYVIKSLQKQLREADNNVYLDAAACYFLIALIDLNAEETARNDTRQVRHPSEVEAGERIEELRGRLKEALK